MDGTLLDKKYNIVGRIEALEEGGGGGGYVLPTASDETLGGIKVGNGLEIDPETGVLSNTNPTPYTPVSYSTTEQKTGKKWIDGKDIYIKVFVFENVAAATAVDQPHGITGLYEVMKMGGTCLLSDRWAILPYNDDIATYQRSVVLRGNNITITGYANSAAITKAYVVLEYTKSEVTRKKK